MTKLVHLIPSEAPADIQFTDIGCRDLRELSKKLNAQEPVEFWDKKDLAFSRRGLQLAMDRALKGLPVLAAHWERDGEDTWYFAAPTCKCAKCGHIFRPTPEEPEDVCNACLCADQVSKTGAAAFHRCQCSAQCSEVWTVE